MFELVKVAVTPRPKREAGWLQVLPNEQQGGYTPAGA